MILPQWVKDKIADFSPPETGKVTIVLELYRSGVTKMEIGPSVRFSAEHSEDRKQNG